MEPDLEGVLSDDGLMCGSVIVESMRSKIINLASSIHGHSLNK